MATTTLNYLLESLRLRIGDMVEPYRYLDTWLLSALLLASKNSYRYLKTKYLVTGEEVYRNPDSAQFFEFAEDVSGDVIEKHDEYLIVLLAAIIVLSGSLESHAWDVGSWKDAEISYSNIESSRARVNNLERLQKELNDYVLPPTKKLATTRKSSLPGYLNNTYEREGDY